MRILGIVLALMLVAIQYPLWFGKGGWLRVWELDRQLTAQRANNPGYARLPGSGTSSSGSKL